MSMRIGSSTVVAMIVLAGTSVAVSAEVTAATPAGQRAADVRLGAVATAAISIDDVWLVGHQQVSGMPRATLARHWDGSGWTTVPTVDLGDKYNGLSAISATSSTDVWAIGYYRSQGGQDRGLALHWDGVKWSDVPMAQPPDNVRLELKSLVAVTPDDAWAVGTLNGHGTSPAAEHWDGQTWSMVDGLAPATALSGVDATSPDDVWVVGATSDNEPYSAHWDGGSWTPLSTPAPPAGFATYPAVSAITSKDVWYVGSYYDGTEHPYLLHWDGNAWMSTRAGRLETTWASLTSVDASASNDVWAVGLTRPETGTEKTLIEHWDGFRWRVVASPSPLHRCQLTSVSAIGARDAWAVGNDNFWHVVSVHWNGHRWSNK
jgi:hypothetical protein